MGRSLAMVLGVDAVRVINTSGGPSTLPRSHRLESGWDNRALWLMSFSSQRSVTPLLMFKVEKLRLREAPQLAGHVAWTAGLSLWQLSTTMGFSAPEGGVL